MRLGILNMNHQIIGQVGIKIKTSITGVRNQTRCRKYVSIKMEDQFCKQNKLAKSANFVSKNKAKHAIEE